MTTHVDEILRTALALAPNERAEIAASLIASLDAHSADELDAAWSQEIQRRIDEIDRGEVELIPAEDVVRSMRERLHG